MAGRSRRIVTKKLWSRRRYFSLFVIKFVQEGLGWARAFVAWEMGVRVMGFGGLWLQGIELGVVVVMITDTGSFERGYFHLSTG